MARLVAFAWCALSACSSQDHSPCHATAVSPLTAPLPDGSQTTVRYATTLTDYAPWELDIFLTTNGNACPSPWFSQSNSAGETPPVGSEISGIWIYLPPTSMGFLGTYQFGYAGPGTTFSAFAGTFSVLAGTSFDWGGGHTALKPLYGEVTITEWDGQHAVGTLSAVTDDGQPVDVDFDAPVCTGGC
jgi:hypothetical protein